MAKRRSESPAAQGAGLGPRAQLLDTWVEKTKLLTSLATAELLSSDGAASIRGVLVDELRRLLHGALGSDLHSKVNQLAEGAACLEQTRTQRSAALSSRPSRPSTARRACLSARDASSEIPSTSVVSVVSEALLLAERLAWGRESSDSLSEARATLGARGLLDARAAKPQKTTTHDSAEVGRTQRPPQLPRPRNGTRSRSTAAAATGRPPGAATPCRNLAYLHSRGGAPVSIFSV